MNEPYILFAFGKYEASGGINDYIGRYPSANEAKEAAFQLKSKMSMYYWHVWNCDTEEITGTGLIDVSA